MKKNTFHFLLQLCIASVTTVVFATENDDRNYCKHGYPEVENPTIENVENPQIQAVDIPLL